MRKQNRLASFLLVVFVPTVLGFFQPLRALAEVRPTEQAASLSVEDVLWWLPPDTESLMVAQGPFQLIPPSESGSSKERRLEIHLQFSTLVLMGTEEQETGPDALFPRALRRARVQFALLASRNSRAPKGLGSMPFDGCGVMVFSRDSIRQVDKYVSDVEKQARPKKKRFRDDVVLVWEEGMEDDKWTIYLVRPDPNILIVATDETYLHETLERMTTRPAARAFSESLPEWKYVDRQAAYWGLRHFDPRRAKTDPSSPFGGKKAANMPDDYATGMTFSYNGKAGSPPILYYLSENPKAAELAAGFWHGIEQGLDATARQVLLGVVEITVSMDETNGLYVFTFAWMMLMGHGVYL